MIDLRLLQTFRVLHELGTVTAAARQLSLSPSAVSQQLRQLSRDVGADLLEPDGRRVRLTPAGRVLLRHADRLCAQWEQARADLQAHEDSPHRLVRMGGFATSVDALLAPAAADLLRATPATYTHITEVGRGHDCYRQLMTGQLDIAVLPPLPDSPPVDDPRFHQEPLLDDVIDLVVPAGHRLAGRDGVDLSEAAADDWISPHHDQDALVHALCAAAGFTPRMVHHADDWHAVLALIGHGLGVCLVPRLVPVVRRHDLARVRLGDRPPVSRRILTCVRRGSERQAPIAEGLRALRARASRSGPPAGGPARPCR